MIFARKTTEVWKYYAASDVFLVPTKYEAFGLTVLEAMATGLPVLVSQEAGAAELIEDGRNGLLLDDPRDVNEIAGWLDEVLSDHDLRRELGERARQTALQHRWEDVAEDTLAVYRYAIGQRKGDIPVTPHRPGRLRSKACRVIFPSATGTCW